MPLFFKPIDVDHHGHSCIEFRRDSYFCSFGHYQGVEESLQGYTDRILTRQQDERWHFWHVWSGDSDETSLKLVGQLDFRTFSDYPETGYVHLMYVTPDQRGSQVAAKMQAFLKSQLKNSGCRYAILSVAQHNQRAIAHYQKQGWQCWKANPKHVEPFDFYRCEL